MNAAPALGVVLLTGAALAAVPASPAQAQAALTHEVRKGDTLFGVARKLGYEGVTRNQLILAIYRANRDSFPGGNIHLLEIGTVLAIPARDEIARIDTAEADRQLRELLAAKPAAPVPPLAAVKPAPNVRAPAKPSAAVTPAPEEAARRYREGLSMERRGDHQAALAAFLDAGEAGNGEAQRKLGQIYDKGNTAVQRDYQSALRWYQKARAQGVEMDKPLQRTTPR